MYPRIHTKPIFTASYDRLDMLWERYPQFHKMETFTTLDDLLTEHESYQADFEDLREEYVLRQYDRFLVQLSWADLPYRYETRKIIENADLPEDNPYITAFMEQFADLDTEHKACFLFAESYVSQFFVIMEVCQRAEILRQVSPLFPDEEKVHYLAVFDKQNMDDVLLMFHLLYTSTSEDLFGGYSLYDYPFPWYQNHLWMDKVVLRSPFLPDRIAKYQGNIPFYHNPAKTVYVRRNIEHILENGYCQSELEFFLGLTKVIMPFFHWWYEDLALYEEKDGYRTDWRMQRTKIRTDLTAKGVIKPKWKHELTLFQEVHKLYPDVLYQYRPEWLGRQSLDMFIPSLRTAIEYQGIQHYLPVSFFGGEEALEQRRQLDEQKRALCAQNNVTLIEWPYDLEPTHRNICKILEMHKEDLMEGNMNIAAFSRHYDIRVMRDDDAPLLYALFTGNPQFYQYSKEGLDRDHVTSDLRALPSGKGLRDKYYVGYFSEDRLVAVLDLIDGYPESGVAFIGFFMMAREAQGNGSGTQIISDLMDYLRQEGFREAHLAIDKGNPQSEHFWKKNGFTIAREVTDEGHILLYAVKSLMREENAS